VWVTAQVVAALRRKPFPLRAPSRRSKRRAVSSTVHSAARPRRPSRAHSPPAQHARASGGERMRRSIGPPQPVAARAVAARAPSPGEQGGSPAAPLAVAGAAALCVGVLAVWLWRRRQA